MDDKQAWHAASDEFDKIKVFLDKPRCINCEEFYNGQCGHYGPVPEAHQYKPNECPKWMVKIPF
jgi:hypothetical protein